MNIEAKANKVSETNLQQKIVFVGHSEITQSFEAIVNFNSNPIKSYHSD
jgi:hypothetical protein